MSFSKKLPIASKKLATPFIIPIITSLSTIELTTCSQALLTLFKAASIPSKYVAI